MRNETNPYTLSFGKKPLNLIHRDYQSNEIIESFLSDNPSYQVCMITGIRGSGKTVALTTIANNLEDLGGWIVVNLNPERNLLHDLACELISKKEIIKKAKINISSLGFEIDIANNSSNQNDVVVLRNILKKLSDRGKKILITVDEVVPTKNFKEFANQIQIFIREEINIFLLMSGLYENINNLQNEKTLTFLYRSPKMELEPLDELLMSKSYKNNLSVSQEEAIKMSKFTKGYAFAFQVLGYLCFKKKIKLEDAEVEFDEYMAQYSYNKIWDECSLKDKMILKEISSKPKKNESIRKKLKINSSLFSVYRDRLIKKGLVKSNTYGTMELTLPRFEEFVKTKIYE